MPSLTHEGILCLFRNRPELAPELLRDALHVPLPAYAKARIDRGDGTVHRMRWDGSDGKEIVTSARSPVAIAVDSDGIYWTERGTDPDLLDGRVRAPDLDGKLARTLADVPSPVAIAVDGNYVYAATKGTLDNGYRDGSIIKMRKR